MDGPFELLLGTGLDPLEDLGGGQPDGSLATTAAVYALWSSTTFEHLPVLRGASA